MKKIFKKIITCICVGTLAISNISISSENKAYAYVWGWECWTFNSTPPGSAKYPYSSNRYFGRNYISNNNWHVNGIQGLLNRGYDTDTTMANRLTVDGIFGYNTENSVIKFQEYRDLNPDGIVGVLTYQSLVYETRSKKYTYETTNGNVCVIDWSNNSYNVM